MSRSRAEPTLEPWREELRAIGSWEERLLASDDRALDRRVERLRQRALAGGALDDLLAESFALAREAARRTVAMRPFEVQMAAGVALHRGAVVEMQTGEGKTLAAVAPVFLNALTGSGVHVLTFNDYLARRDAAWMGPAYRFLGLSVGCVQEGMSVAARQAAYACDVTYLTAKEAGFDHLRDGLCLDPGEQVQRPFNMALVDEADSIMVDEARIPLVIAGAIETRRPALPRLAALVRELAPGADWSTDENARNVFLTERGSERAEALLDCGDLFSGPNLELLAAIRNALHAEVLLERDVDYIVRRGRVELVDELTGRVADKRHWPDGLQAAVEAKEGLRLGEDGRILGSIALQHYLALYPRLAGMTATAHSAADDFAEFYGLEVSVVPPHRPSIRRDHPDRVFSHREGKTRALIAEIERQHERGRPILVGTVSVAESERLAARLRGAGVPCQVLNARNDEEEARIVAEAGAPGAVTISTNMAGRGTDIKLGGGDERERERVVTLGGLYVVGTHRHESRRIDRQLRGRAGRQGDPGSSRFFLCLEDELLRRHGLHKMMPAGLFRRRSQVPIDSTLVRREIDRAQRIAEGQGYDIRKRLWSYSQILERQRRYIQEWRQAVLEGRSGHLVAERRCAERWRSLRPALGEEGLRLAERELTLRVIDSCWSEYLTDMQRTRDEVPLVALDGRDPLAEFYRTAIRAFEELLERIDDEIVNGFSTLQLGPGGVDWDARGLRGPSATWTYLVSDNVFGSNLLGTLANRPTLALWGVLVLGPVLFAWGVYLRIVQRRKRRQAPNDDP